MRTVIMTIVIIFIACSIAWGGELKPEHFNGEILWKDGSKITYTKLLGPGGGKLDELSYTKNVEDIMNLDERTHYTADLARIKISAVCRIDFIDFSSSEKSLLKEAKTLSKFKKANVTFCDGVILKDIYLNCTYADWEGYHERGRLSTPNIMSITINIKGAKECPRCSRQYRETGWKFCPFDGSTLK